MIELRHGRAAWMRMRIDQARQNHRPAKVHQLGPGTFEFQHLPCRADLLNSAVAHRYRFRNRKFLIDRNNPPAMHDQVRLGQKPATCEHSAKHKDYRTHGWHFKPTAAGSNSVLRSKKPWQTRLVR